MLLFKNSIFSTIDYSWSSSICIIYFFSLKNQKQQYTLKIKVDEGKGKKRKSTTACVFLKTVKKCPLKKKKTICFLNTCATLIDLTSFTAIAGLTPLRFVRFAFLNVILKTSTLFLRSNKNIYIFCCFQKKKKKFLV